MTSVYMIMRDFLRYLAKQLSDKLTINIVGAASQRQK